MSEKERRQRITLMLRRHRDAMSAGGLGDHREAHDSRLLLWPREYNEAHRELARSLDALKACANLDPPGRVVHWHTLEAYVCVTVVQVATYTRKLTRDGWVSQISGYRLVERPHRDLDVSCANLGVAWLADEYRWDRVHLRLIMDACGEQIAA